MTNFTIRPVRTKADKKKFLAFLYTFYQADPYWVAPLRMERKKLIDRQHNPFYHHAQLALYLAEREGQVIGRIGAIVNARHNQAHQEKVGFFGFFECVPEPLVAHALFDTAHQFLHAHGMETMRGPASPSVNDEYGLLVDGFQASPVVLMPYNPPYYRELLEGYGFTKAKDLYAYLLDQETVYTEKLVRAHGRVIQRNRLTFRALNMHDFGDCSKDTGFIQPVHDGVRRGFVDGLRLGLHATYPRPSGHGSALASAPGRHSFASCDSAGCPAPLHSRWRAAVCRQETSGPFPR